MSLATPAPSTRLAFLDWTRGLVPAIFLFLAGATLAFLMHRKERQGAAAGARLLAALRRGGYLLGIAFLFRLQLWLAQQPRN